MSLKVGVVNSLVLLVFCGVTEHSTTCGGFFVFWPGDEVSLFPQNMMLGIQATECNLWVIRQEDFVFHGLRVIQVLFFCKL